MSLGCHVLAIDFISAPRDRRKSKKESEFFEFFQHFKIFIPFFIIFLFPFHSLSLSLTLSLSVYAYNFLIYRKRNPSNVLVHDLKHLSINSISQITLEFYLIFFYLFHFSFSLFITCICFSVVFFFQWN